MKSSEQRSFSFGQFLSFTVSFDYFTSGIDMTTITSNKSVIVATSDVMSTLSSKGMTTIVIESTSTSESMGTTIPSGIYECKIT